MGVSEEVPAEGLVARLGRTVGVCVFEHHQVVCHVGPLFGLRQDDVGVLAARGLVREQTQIGLLPVNPVGALRVAGDRLAEDPLVLFPEVPTRHALQREGDREPTIVHPEFVAILEQRSIVAACSVPGRVEFEGDVFRLRRVEFACDALHALHQEAIDKQLQAGTDVEDDVTGRPSRVLAARSGETRGPVGDAQLL